MKAFERRLVEQIRVSLIRMFEEKFSHDEIQEIFKDPKKFEPAFYNEQMKERTSLEEATNRLLNLLNKVT